jgi:hypothetical protein
LSRIQAEFSKVVEGIIADNLVAKYAPASSLHLSSVLSVLLVALIFLYASWPAFLILIEWWFYVDTGKGQRLR